MKKILVSLAAAFVTAGAAAAPATPLPPGPIYLKFTGQEQIAINGATTFAGTKEINWGVFIVSTMETGDVNTPNDQIDPTGNNFFVNKQSGGQITGMFYGIEAGGASGANPFPATGGYLDLYWRDLDKLSASTLTKEIGPSIRCGFDCATGFTEGTFLARLYFDTGMDIDNKLNTIVGSVVPSSKGFSGQADSYASVDVSKTGLWTEQLNSNYFTTSDGDSRDLRFKNSYNANVNWNSKTNGNILGARVDDPGQAYALPEPGALSLMGLAMIGMGAALRRRRG